MSIWLEDDEELWSNFLVRNGSEKKTTPTSEKKGGGHTPNRTVRYEGPGHTVVGYENRILDIRFRESQKQYDARKRARKRAAARKGAAHRSPRVSYYNGEMTYAQRSNAEKGMRRIYEKGLNRDEYTKEDMRALLKDAHWEEVCGHSRWKYDNKTLVKEFNKYMKERGGMY